MSLSHLEEDFGTIYTRTSIGKDILEDLCSRFLINIPDEEKNDILRICFQIELAHWFYLDFYRQEDPSLPGIGLQDFMQAIFSEFSFLNKSSVSIQDVFSNWKKYKFEVPVYGAIMLDVSMDCCVLVRPFRKRISWGFPKGKVNKDEEDFECAIREVKEETGFDISNYIMKSEYLERDFHGHRVRLYIVPEIPSSSKFKPQTRQEIEDVQWFPIDALPSHKKDSVCRDKLGLNPSSFFMVQPFVKDLRKWVKQRKAETRDKLQLTNPLLSSLGRSKVSAFTPVAQDKFSQGIARVGLPGEDFFRKRKEEEQRKFQQKQLNTHPFMNIELEDEEEVLGDLILKHDIGRQASPVKAEQQPEAIRKLLTGTVGVSPAGMATLQHDLAPKTSKGEARSLTASRERSVSLVLAPSMDSDAKEDAFHFGEPLFTDRLKGDETNTELNMKSRGWYTESFRSSFGKGSQVKAKSPVGSYQGKAKLKEQKFANKRVTKSSGTEEWSFEIPEFLNFKFDLDAVKKTLPTAV